MSASYPEAYTPTTDSQYSILNSLYKQSEILGSFGNGFLAVTDAIGNFGVSVDPGRALSEGIILKMKKLSMFQWWPQALK